MIGDTLSLYTVNMSLEMWCKPEDQRKLFMELKIWINFAFLSSQSVIDGFDYSVHNKHKHLVTNSGVITLIELKKKEASSSLHSRIPLKHSVWFLLLLRWIYE
ncbi:hypothetical protein EG68_07834 [Paragonimus skrjabini miyazakii]|uniref:Uncharacterized protein n=1 Tax=Paragonimus skrjabini miyazakii TaxID=59628 RepID=A0A8S9YKE7_9TREM|nr:hypothetical protein EG68_07834 [Paragonimus skrjabini miyazakii]